MLTGPESVCLCVCVSACVYQMEAEIQNALKALQHASSAMDTGDAVTGFYFSLFIYLFSKKNSFPALSSETSW